MGTQSAEARWWEIAARGVMLRGTVQGRPDPPDPHDPPDPPDPQGAAVVAIHGGPGVDGGGLRHVLAPVADHAQLVVPDLRGHGRSDLATPSSWTLDDWADDLAVGIDQLALHRPVVVGVSFGGWVALRLAARHPDLVGSLVVAATSARLPTLEEGCERMRSLGGERAAHLWRAVHADWGVGETAAFAEHVTSLMSSHRPGPELTAVRAAQVRTPQVDEHFTPMFAQLDLTGDARAVRCPATVVVGERDPLTTPRLATATAEAFPGGARLTIVPGAAHDLLVDAPERLLAEIDLALVARQDR